MEDGTLAVPLWAARRIKSLAKVTKDHDASLLRPERAVLVVVDLQEKLLRSRDASGWSGTVCS